MNSYVVHLKNKFPGGRVAETETAIDAFDKAGIHQVAMRKNGAGQWVDKSKEVGAAGEFDLAPIPRDARVHAVTSEGRGLHVDAEKRKKARGKFEEKNRILSMKELEEKGWRFNDKGEVSGEPSKEPQEKRADAKPESEQLSGSDQ